MRGMISACLIGVGAVGAASAQSPSQPACEAGDAEACIRAGTEYAEGTGVAASVNTSIPFFLQACDRGKAEGCTSAGLLVINGAGDVPPNPEAGMFFFEQACKRGDEKGCESAVTYLTADNHPARDTSKVVDLLIDGCKAGSMWACGWGSRAALDGYAGEYPEMTDLSKAAIIAEIGCSKNNLSGCVVSETVFADPDSALFDAEKSLKYSQINCDEDIAESCNNLARIYYMVEEIELGTAAYEKACSLGMGQTCADASRMRNYLTELAEYEAVEAERSEAISSLIDAGRYGDAVSSAIHQFGSTKAVETAIQAANSAGAMSSINTQDLYVVASWFSSGNVRAIADAEMAARGTGLEGSFGTGTNSAGAAAARWDDLYGSSIPTARTYSGPASAPPAVLGAGDAAAQVREKYRYAHCEMAGSNTSAAVCR